jgi:hypothetical protein
MATPERTTAAAFPRYAAAKCWPTTPFSPGWGFTCGASGFHALWIGSSFLPRLIAWGTLPKAEHGGWRHSGVSCCRLIVLLGSFHLGLHAVPIHGHERAGAHHWEKHFTMTGVLTQTSAVRAKKVGEISEYLGVGRRKSRIAARASFATRRAASLRQVLRKRGSPSNNLSCR